MSNCELSRRLQVWNLLDTSSVFLTTSSRARLEVYLESETYTYLPLKDDYEKLFLSGKSIKDDKVLEKGENIQKILNVPSKTEVTVLCSKIDTIGYKCVISWDKRRYQFYVHNHKDLPGYKGLQNGTAVLKLNDFP